MMAWLRFRRRAVPDLPFERVCMEKRRQIQNPRPWCKLKPSVNQTCLLAIRLSLWSYWGQNVSKHKNLQNLWRWRLWLSLSLWREWRGWPVDEITIFVTLVTRLLPHYTRFCGLLNTVHSDLWSSCHRWQKWWRSVFDTRIDLVDLVKMTGGSQIDF